MNNDGKSEVNFLKAVFSDPFFEVPLRIAKVARNFAFSQQRNNKRINYSRQSRRRANCGTRANLKRKCLSSREVYPPVKEMVPFHVGRRCI